MGWILPIPQPPPHHRTGLDRSVSHQQPAACWNTVQYVISPTDGPSVFIARHAAPIIQYHGQLRATILPILIISVINPHPIGNPLGGDWIPVEFRTCDSRNHKKDNTISYHDMRGNITHHVISDGTFLPAERISTSCLPKRHSPVQ